jgi:hypothetical protein
MKKIYLAILLISFITQHSSAQASAQKDSMVYACGPCGSDCDNVAYDKPGICAHCNMPLEKISLSDFKKRLNAKPVTIAFYLQDNVEVLDFAGPMEVFITAGFNGFTVSKTYKPIRSKTVLFITPDYTIQDAPKSDILVVFGGPTQQTTDDPRSNGMDKGANCKRSIYYVGLYRCFHFGQGRVIG